MIFSKNARERLLFLKRMIRLVHRFHDRTLTYRSLLYVTWYVNDGWNIAILNHGRWHRNGYISCEQKKEKVVCTYLPVLLYGWLLFTPPYSLFRPFSAAVERNFLWFQFCVVAVLWIRPSAALRLAYCRTTKSYPR